MKNLRTQLFIDNQWVDSVAGDCFETVDPSNETVIAKVSRARSEDVDLAPPTPSSISEVSYLILCPVIDDFDPSAS